METATDKADRRLGTFILENMEEILVEWESFARTLWDGPLPSSAALRNDAEKMLRAVVADMATDQTLREQKTKSEGGAGGDVSGVDAAATGHALARVNDNFDIKRMVAEFRALRATVSRLWWASRPTPHKDQIEDMERFNEGFDQLLAASVTSFTDRIDQSRRLFLGILGHDLRQPLYSIKMFSDVLLSPKAPDDGRPLVSSIGRCCDGMAKLLTDLLDFTSSQLGSPMPIYPTPCDIGTVCGNVVEEVRAASPSAALYYDAGPDLEGSWDKGRLRQLISNLLTNALHHGEPKGPVTARLQGGEGEVTLTVHNFGKPIPDHAIGTLFDPMVRIAAVEKFRPHGSVGLGLYICRQIAVSHGGDIAVKSSPEDGTTFTVRLPKRLEAHEARNCGERDP
jgi:signal transduction histidine kinase